MKRSSILWGIVAAWGVILFTSSFLNATAQTRELDARGLRQAYDRGNLSSTATTIRRSKTSDPELILLAANCYRQLQQVDDFSEMIKRAQKVAGDSDSLATSVALARIQVGDCTESSMEIVAMLVNRGVSKGDARQTVADGCIARRDSQGFSQLLNQWQLQDPNSHGRHYVQALLAIKQSRLEDAESLLIQSIMDNEQHELSYLSLVEIYSKSVMMDLAKCRFVCEQCLQSFPHNQDFAVLLSQAYRKLGNAKAARKIMEALESRPEVIFEKAEIAFDLGEYQNSIDLVRKGGMITSPKIAKMIDADFRSTIKGGRSAGARSRANTAATAMKISGDKKEGAAVFRILADRTIRQRRFFDLQQKLRLFPGNQAIIDEIKVIVEPAMRQECPTLDGEFIDPPAKDLPAGDSLYLEHCEACHGAKGDGGGMAAKHLFPPPRSFRQEPLRFVSTVNGIASDEDIARTIREGLGGASMPAFPELTSEQNGQLVAVVRRLQIEGLREQYQAKSLEMRSEQDEISPDRESFDRESFDRWVEERSTAGSPLPIPPFKDSSDKDDFPDARSLLDRAACSQCHAITAEADSPRLSFFDSLGRSLPIRRLANDPFRGGNSLESIYRRIVLGIPGTPHPAIHGFSEKEIMAMTQYVHELSDHPQPKRNSQPATTNFQRRRQMLETTHRPTSSVTNH